MVRQLASLAERFARGAQWRPAAPYALSILLVVLAAVIAELLYRRLGVTRLSSVFLTSVLLAAIWFGRRPAFLAAALAFGLYNFYLVEPRFTLTLGSVEDVLTLLIFLVVALLTGGLAGRLSDEARRSKARAGALNAMFQASHTFALISDEAILKSSLASHVARAVKGEAIVVDGARWWRSQWSNDESNFGQSAPSLEGPVTAEAVGWSTRPLSAKSQSAEVRWRPGREAQLDESTADLVDVLLKSAEAALIRISFAAELASAEAVARTDQLRATLLASVSHDLRTPLTAIMTSASSLLEFDDRFSAETRADLIATIQEEAERLGRYVGNLLNMTRLESGALSVDLAPTPITEVLERLATRYSRRSGGRQIEVDARSDAVALVDGLLLEQALSNVLENAIRYSAPSATVKLALRDEGNFLVIEVIDSGPGVPCDELQLIFEKFYRATKAKASGPGVGLGLSIARGLVEAMGGSVSAHPSKGGAGLTVAVRIPVAEAA